MVFFKKIAVITMLIDHSCDVIIKHYSMGYVIGRIAFPLFAFQLVIGYRNTHDIKKYLKLLLIFALISQLPYGLMFYNYVHKIDINIFFTLFFALLTFNKYTINDVTSIAIIIIPDIIIPKVIFSSFSLKCTPI